MATNLHRRTIRILLGTLYLVISAFAVFGLSSVFAYLNTGADRSLMLYNKINEVVHYQPTISWNTNHTIGRQIDDITLKKVEKDYLNSWYVKSVSFEENISKGLKDYYTKSALEDLLTGIEYNDKNKINVQSTTLNHNASIDFFSEDGQLVVITDKEVKEHKRVFSNNKIQHATTEFNNYRFLLLLEDGFWRIRHILKTSPSKKTQLDFKNRKLNTSIKGINYYPQETPWDLFGENFSTKIISNDFDIIQKAGLNTIRIFIQYEDFGKSEVKPEKLNKLNELLNCAQNKNLEVILTLFDFYGNYDVIDWTLNNKHAISIINSCKSHPALAAWDIKNEPNLDFKSRGKEKVTAWLEQMISTVKSTDTIHPVTIGWSNVESAPIFKDQVDFVSYHYYEDLDDLEKKHHTLKKSIPNKRVVLSEYGISSNVSLWSPLGNTEADQAEYHKKFQNIAQKNKIESLSWTLYDFTKVPKEVVGKLPWRKHKQKHFGFINSKQKRKKSFKYIAKP